MPPPSPSGAETILFLCTGNLCRSPMAEWSLRDRLGPSSDLLVSSAGYATIGAPAPRPVVELMGAVGIDLSAHRSRLVTERMLAGADLVIGMTRQHVVDAVVMAPSAWIRCFTLTDLVARIRETGSKLPDETVAGWAARLQAGRTRASLMQLPMSGDVPDPMGGNRRDYQRVRDLILPAMAELAGALAPA